MRAVHARSALLKLMIGVGLALTPACVRPDAEPAASSATVTAARAPRRAPLLASVAVHVAANEVSLRAQQAATATGLESEIDHATSPVEEARIVFLEVVAQSVEGDHWNQARIDVAEARLVRAVEQALPELRETLVRLHDTLTPEQRHEVVESVVERWSWWTGRWKDGRADEERAWLEAFARDDFAKQTAELDQRVPATVKGWAERTKRIAEGERAKLDAGDRRDLAARLRADITLE